MRSQGHCMAQSGSRYQQQMIKTALRGLEAAALVVLPLAAAPPAHAAETVPLAIAVDRLPLVTASREGYQRTSFKHWNAGNNPTGGCNIRAEVLISEAVEAPEIGPGCWYPIFPRVLFVLTGASKPGWAIG